MRFILEWQGILQLSRKEIGSGRPKRAYNFAVRKAVNANPGLKDNRGKNFSSRKMLSIAYSLCS